MQIRMIGFYAGEEQPFAELFRAYSELNAKISECLRQKALGKEC